MKTVGFWFLIRYQVKDKEGVVCPTKD